MISIMFTGEAKSWLAILGLTIAISGGAWYGLVQRDIASRRNTVQAAEHPGVLDVRGRPHFSRFDPRPGTPHFSTFGRLAEQRPFCESKKK